MLRQGSVTFEGEPTPLSATSTGGGRLVIQAMRDNAGFVRVGTSTVDGESGISLDSGETLILPADDLSKVFIDADAEGEGVTFLVT